MERLTEKLDKLYCCNASYELCMQQKRDPKDPLCCCNCEINQKMYNKLGQYEDLEEQGLILKLPCKEGDPVYTINYYDDCDFSENCPEFHKCEEEIRCEYQYKKYFVAEAKFQIPMIALLGKKVFATEEAAKAALKAMQEGE